MLEACDRAALRVLRSAPLIGKWTEAMYVDINNTDWTWLQAAGECSTRCSRSLQISPFFLPQAHMCHQSCSDVCILKHGLWLLAFFFQNVELWTNKMSMSVVSLFKRRHPAHLIQMRSLTSKFCLKSLSFMAASVSSADFCEFIHHQHFFSFFFLGPSAH